MTTTVTLTLTLLFIPHLDRQFMVHSQRLCAATHCNEHSDPQLLALALTQTQLQELGAEIARLQQENACLEELGVGVEVQCQVCARTVQGPRRSP